MKIFWRPGHANVYPDLAVLASGTEAPNSKHQAPTARIAKWPDWLSELGNSLVLGCWGLELLLDRNVCCLTDRYFFLNTSMAFQASSGGASSYSSARSRYIFAKLSSG